MYDIPIAENRQQENETIAENPSAENPSAENRQTKKERNSKKEIVIKKYISNEKINLKFIDFLTHRQQMKKPMTEIAIGQAITKIEAWLQKYSEDQVLFIIGKSIENSWQGLFDDVLKNYNQKSQATKPV